MARSWLKKTSGRRVWPPRGMGRRDWVGAAVVEPREPRVILSGTALFSGGELKVTGDDQDNVIMISRTVGGTILVNNGAVAIAGGVATVANTTHLHLVGAGGNDNISLDESNGRLPGTDLFGGA